MSTIAIATRARRVHDAGYQFGLAGLVLLWALTTGLTLFVLAIAFLPGHAGMGEMLQRLADALPTDPRSWAGFTA